MLYDKARVFIEAGRGGDGCVSFRREAHVPRGGPDGGDGGRGGNVELVCDPSRRDLAELRFSPRLVAGRGGHGQGKQRHGARGEERIARVPPGTSVEGLDDARIELLRDGQRAVIAMGGSGGHGNKRFANSTRQAPHFAESGLAGESGWIELHLKLLADAGLIGLPNAGKSSLLARLTRAAPKIADYPFTTLEPVLGTIQGDDRQLVLADIPGLIEGAAGGAGLGHDFLAHVERCRVLVHVVDIAPPEGDPVEAHATVRAELASYGAGLEELPELVVLSKLDLVPPEEAEPAIAEWRERLGDKALDVMAASSATGAGLEDLSKRILELTPAPSPDEPVFSLDETSDLLREVEHRIYRPGQEEGYDVVEEGKGIFRVEGRGIELLIERHDMSNPDALAYVEQRLREIGVVSALREAGFEEGDELRVGEVAFDFHPA